MEKWEFLMKDIVKGDIVFVDQKPISYEVDFVTTYHHIRTIWIKDNSTIPVIESRVAKANKKETHIFKLQKSKNYDY